MKPAIKYSIVAVVVVVFLIAFIWLSGGSSNPEKTKTPEQRKIDSVTKIVEKKKREKELKLKPIPINPYGTFLIRELYKNYDKTVDFKPMQSPIATHLPRKSKNEYPNVYFQIGDGVKITYDDATELIDYVDRGNHAFLSTSDFPYNLQELIFGGYGTYEATDKSMDYQFHHPSLDTTNYLVSYFGDDDTTLVDGTWKYWSTSEIIQDSFAIVSYMERDDYDYEKDKLPVCLRIKIGKGYLFLHSDPILFTNKLLMHQDGLNYAEAMFSHVPKGNVYWHQIAGRYSDDYLARKSDGSEEGNRDTNSRYEERKKSPLEFILNNPALRWALYLSLIGLLIYLIFQSKRRRRIIPSAEKRTNSSLEFVDTVSQMYYQERRHDKLIKHQEFLFLNYIRSRYHLPSGKIDEAFIDKLEKKSGIERPQFMPILKSFAFARTNSNITDDFLISLHNNTENFYKNCN